MKTVCVVGAGPAGLSSAKVLLRTSQFDVTIFEQADKIGGIWNIDPKSPSNGFLHPDTLTNLSRFTVAFSDLDWHSVGLETVPMFPKAWQVNRYLEAYAKKNIPSCVFRFGYKVVKTELLDNRWEITSQDVKGQETVHHFDHLLLGSGFFSQARPIDRDVPNVASDLRIKAIHSSQFRSLQDLFADAVDATGKKILIIGGGNSAGEAAAAVAQQLSDAWYSPITGQKQPYKDCKIVHVTPRALYALPPYNPVDEQYQTYVPLDLKLYDLSKRPAGPIKGYAGQLTVAVKDMIHSALQTQIGGDQSDLGSPGLKIPSQEPRSAVYVALSESYPEFVRSGLIDVRSGRVTSIQHSPPDTYSATIRNDEGAFDDLSNIGAIIYATGYSPSTAVNFLPEDVKQKLHYDATSARLPLVLSGWQTMSPEVPSLALIGFYEGPYWGMIETQARFTAQRWLDGTLPTTNPYEEPNTLLDLRQAMKEKSLFVPQYWFGDYAGYMEELASSSLLNLTRNDAPFASDRIGPICPARYLLSPAGDDTAQASATMHDLHQTWLRCTQKGLYVPRAAFRALQGHWAIRRTTTIDSKQLPTSFILEGEAQFHPRIPTAPTFDLEYLYIESGGLLALSTGAATMTMTAAKRRYVYRYSEVRDEVSVWFVKQPPDDDNQESLSLEVDCLFHNLEFPPPPPPSPNENIAGGAVVAAAVAARSDYLCVKDMDMDVHYVTETEYTFPLQGIAMHNFRTVLRRRVQGPAAAAEEVHPTATTTTTTTTTTYHRRRSLRGA